MAGEQVELWGLLKQKFEILKLEGRHEEALRLFERLLDVAERTFPRGAPHHIETLVSGARARHHLGQIEAARDLFLRALEAAEAFPGTAPATLSALCDAIRSLGEELGDSEFALYYFRLAADHALAAVSQERTPQRVREAAILLNNLGLFEKRAGRFEEAASRYKAAIGLLEPMRDHDDLLADALNNLGVLLIDAGDLPRAAEAHRRALALRESCPAATLADIAQSHTNLAVIAHSSGKFEEALASCEKALGLLDSDPVACPGELDSLIHNYAALLRQLGRSDEAAKLEMRLSKEFQAEGTEAGASNHGV